MEIVVIRNGDFLYIRFTKKFQDMQLEPGDIVCVKKEVSMNEEEQRAWRCLEVIDEAFRNGELMNFIDWLIHQAYKLGLESKVEINVSVLPK